MADVKLNDRLQAYGSEVAKIVRAVSDATDEVFTELPHRRWKEATKNIYGETQEALDVWTNQIFLKRMQETGCVKAYISEELGEPWINPDDTGGYTVTIDPLDGSSNIESNNCFGTIVGIHKEKDLLAEGRKQVLAFYNLYGPITTLVTADGKHACEYVKHRKGSSDYWLWKEGLKLSDPGKLMGLGGSPNKWTPAVKDFVDYMTTLKLKVRYGGAFVGDINQILFYGGCFMYPEMTDKPQGKLRLVIECNPMAYIISTAGGYASNGVSAILDAKPKEYDERTPVYIGSTSVVRKFEEIRAKYK
ncbi:MAG: fructose-1,6-bisphosphatase [Candidatus Altiarchaeota archaeon]|nr:fructose-1,6-bisphosphatase [Candidatus Altiarchaeota archaeon]